MNKNKKAKPTNAIMVAGVILVEIPSKMDQKTANDLASRLNLAKNTKYIKDRVSV